MSLTELELRACHLILAAARREAPFDEMGKQMRREGIPEQTGRLLYEKCGVKVLISGKRDNAERYVYAPDNLLPFAPRTVHRSYLSSLTFLIGG
jgi:hypothetical protein